MVEQWQVVVHGSLTDATRMEVAEAILHAKLLLERFINAAESK